MDATDADETAAALREAHECARARVRLRRRPSPARQPVQHAHQWAYRWSPDARNRCFPPCGCSRREVGLKARDATVVALFPYAVGQKALPVRPVVATIPTDFTPNPSADEVEAVFTQPLERFLSTEGHSSREIHFTRPAVGLGPGSVRMHSFQCGEHVVFGLTAHFCIQVAKVAFSKEPDFEEQSPNTALRLGTVLLPRPGGTAALDAAAPNARGGDADGASGPAACSGGDDVGAPPGGGGGLTRVAAAGQQHCGPPAAASQVGGDMRRGRDAAATATGGGRAAHCWGCDAGTTAGGGGQPPSQQQQQQLRAGDGCGGGGARQPLALAAVAARL